MARGGTEARWLVAWLAVSACGALGACGSSAHGQHGQDSGASGGERDGSSHGPACQAATDCVIISKGCCAACVASEDAVRAVRVSEQAAAMAAECPDGPVACGPCPEQPYDPLTPVLRADCREGECVVVDLRERDATACTRDADCELASTGCCGSCGDDPRGWIALHAGNEDPLAPVCDPVPPCVPCESDARPQAFCAQDAHCAVRAPTPAP